MSRVSKINGVLVTDTFVTGFTYNDANSLTISQNGQNDLSVGINYFSGLTITGDVSTYTLSSDTIYITSALTNNNSNTQLLTRNTSTGKIEYRDSSSISGGGVSGDYLPLSGGTVTGNTVFTSGLTATTLSFDTTYTGTTPYGTMSWNTDFGVPQVGMIGGNVVQKVGESVYAYVKNVDTSTLTRGEVVYIYGASGDKISVKRASNTGDTTSSKTLGVVADTTIAVGGFGYVITKGTLDGLNLGAYSAGTILWLSSTPGQFTNVKQYAPYHLVFIGVVQRANPGNGQLYVSPQNGYELDELHNVVATGATYGDLLSFSSDGTNDLWVSTKTLNGSYTITGNTTIGGGLTATTISAGTYQNLPYVTGGTATYTGVNGSILFTYNTGQTFTATGLLDEKTTGGTYSEGVYTFTTNSGNVYNISATTTYSAGIISGGTGWSAVTPLDGQMILPAVKVALYNNSNNIEPIRVYDISSGITGSGGISALTNNDTNYITINYNNGSPIYVVDTVDNTNDSDIILAYIVYRLDTFIHVLEFGNYGAGLPNKLNDRIIMTDRFGWESGLSIGLSGTTGVITLTSGVVWNGSYRQSLIAVNSQDDIFFKNYHVSGNWTATTTGDTINNTFYDNGTNVVSGNTGQYLVNYYYRGQETNDHLYEVFSTNQYNSITEAESATNPELPELITSHAFLVGRIIIGVGENTGYTQTAFATTFLPTGYAPSSGNHNDLSGLQGGTAGQYYHLTLNQYNNVAYKDTSNTFTQNQIISASLSANTINLTNTPTFNNTNTQLLTRNSTTGNIEYSDLSSPNTFNYGLANAMINFNFLT